ncbi:MAG: allantoinase PuuE [Thermoleophilia bacterium]
MSESYDRDMIGYGRDWPDPAWPGDARIAVQFVINYEEGAENCILHGDPASESLLTEFGFAMPRQGERYLPVESMYEYGSRVGFWRLHRLFTEANVPITVNAVAMALERNPEGVAAMVEAGWELSSHGYRWIDHHGLPEEVEREHIRTAIAIHERMTGQRPLGHFIGRRSENTVRLVAEEGGFVYTQDSYADEVPYWIAPSGRPLLVVPYTADVNDHRFATTPGFDWGGPFFEYLRDAFDELYRDGAESPRMMQIGLHNRLVGRPGRIGHLRRFVEHVLSHDRVWLARGIDIANHWIARFPYPG